jgi:glutaminyl-tRNA synthetase
MPTLSGLRRRGFTPASIRAFADKIGVARRDNLIDVALLEYCIREDLNQTATRVMAVLDENPIKVVLTNYPESQEEHLPTDNNPEDPEAGSRTMPFSRELYIEREDFMESPPKKFFRLAPGGMARLKSAYIIRCEEVVKNEQGEVTELRCVYIPESRSGSDTSGLKVQGTLHWVSVPHAITAEVRLYDRLFTLEDLSTAEGDFRDYINPESLRVLKKAYLEPSLQSAQSGDRFQFMRKGYFCLDTDATEGNLVFNRTVTLKDTWSKVQKKE